MLLSSINLNLMVSVALFLKIIKSLLDGRRLKVFSLLKYIMLMSPRAQYLVQLFF